MNKALTKYIYIICSPQLQTSWNSRWSAAGPGRPWKAVFRWRAGLKRRHDLLKFQVKQREMPVQSLQPCSPAFLQYYSGVLYIHLCISSSTGDSANSFFFSSIFACHRLHQHNVRLFSKNTVARFTSPNFCGKWTVSVLLFKIRLQFPLQSFYIYNKFAY